VGDVARIARVVQVSDQAIQHARPLQDVAHENRPGVAAELLVPGLDTNGPVERRGQQVL